MAEPAQALRLPGRSPKPALSSASASSGERGGRLQEVAAPGAVQQLQESLAERQPQLSVLQPQNNSLLPAGPWTLKLKLQDWPLVDAGALGLGPHLVVQLDGEPPRRLTQTDIPMPALTPGSHRLTVYAAMPWGEAVQSPGGQVQLRLHRVAANPLALPAPGSPQLIPVTPSGEYRTATDPVLLDWLLLDAPLQHLREGDDSWRLRVTVNGDSFLVDRTLPLWLKGWRAGSNALLLELVDGVGEPLNPPFNTAVAEVSLAPGAEQPAWRRSRLSPTELALLLGEASPEAVGEPEPAGESEEAGAPEAVDEPEQAVESEAAELEPQQAAMPEPPAVSPAPEPEAAAKAKQPEPPSIEPAPAAPPTPSRPRARDEVRPDGSLIRPRPEGPLAGLRQRFQP
ncbi:MAG: hypothetical protein R6W06_00850 [Prochlorococcaceae cyanobacterium]